ncbi:MAG: DUF6715 family protein [Roseburia sp.]
MKQVRMILAGIVCVALVVGFYYYLSNRTTESVQDTPEISEITKVTTKNLDTSYPATPREVIKFYNRILVCVYNEEYTEAEFEAMAEQIWKMMDTELQENNPLEQYQETLRADVASYHAENKIIATTSVCDSSDVDYQKVQGYECAYVTASYFLQSDSAFNRVSQQYVLRKDSTGKWKIYGFAIVEGSDSNAEEE